MSNPRGLQGATCSSPITSRISARQTCGNSASMMHLVSSFEPRARRTIAWLLDREGPCPVHKKTLASKARAPVQLHECTASDTLCHGFGVGSTIVVLGEELAFSRRWLAVLPCAEGCFWAAKASHKVAGRAMACQQLTIPIQLVFHQTQQCESWSIARACLYHCDTADAS